MHCSRNLTSKFLFIHCHIWNTFATTESISLYIPYMNLLCHIENVKVCLYVLQDLIRDFKFCFCVLKLQKLAYINLYEDSEAIYVMQFL